MGLKVSLANKPTVVVCGKPHMPLQGGAGYRWPPRISLGKQPMCIYSKVFHQVTAWPGHDNEALQGTERE